MRPQVQEEVDPHTETESSTIALEFLSQFDLNLAETFAQVAFPQPQLLENARATLKSLPSNFLSDLIKTMTPKNNFPSLIYNYNSNFNQTSQAQIERLRKARIAKIVLTTRVLGHTRPVHFVLADPLGEMVFSASDDTNIKMWHLPSLSLIMTFKGHSAAVNELVLSPDRRLLASNSDDHTVRLWDIATGACVAVFDDFADLASGEELNNISMAFSPNSAFFAVGLSTTTESFRLYPIAPPSQLRLINEITCPVDSNSNFSSNSNSNFSTNFNTNFSTNSNSNFSTNFNTNSSGFGSSNFSSGFQNTGNLEGLFQDDSPVPFPNYNPADFIHAPPKQSRTHNTRAAVTGLSFSAGGTFMALSEASGELLVFSLIAPSHTWRLKAHDTSCDGVRFLKNAPLRFFTWSQRMGEVKIWTLKDDKPAILQKFSVRTASHRTNLTALAFSRSENFLCGLTSQGVFAWKCTDGANALCHIDDPAYLAQCVDVDCHPVLEHVFIVANRQFITAWDVSAPQKPLNVIYIPVETNKIVSAFWCRDGLTVIAPDLGGGFYVFQPAEAPACRMVEQYFPTDFTVSEWRPGEGQYEEDGVTMTHLAARTVLTDTVGKIIERNYRPIELQELQHRCFVEPTYLYAKRAEEEWLTTKVAPNDKISSSSSIVFAEDGSEAPAKEDARKERIKHSPSREKPPHERKKPKTPRKKKDLGKSNLEFVTYPEIDSETPEDSSSEDFQDEE